MTRWQYPLFLLILSFSGSALALQKQQSFSISNPKSAARAVDLDTLLRMTHLERITKNTLIDLKIKNPKKFAELRQKTLENSSLYQSYIDEVEEAFLERNFFSKHIPHFGRDLYEKYMMGTPIDMARKNAKKQMFLFIKKNWPVLKDTIFNEYDVDNWKIASQITADKLNESFVYSPRGPHSDSFFFAADSWGFVEILKKTLSNGRVVLDVDSRLDNNSPPPEASTVTSEPSSGSGGNSQSEGADGAGAPSGPSDTAF